MVKDQFVGIWQLVSLESRYADGTVVYPFGQDAFGQLWYDAQGNMTGQFMSRNRPSFAKNDWRSGTPEEIKTAFEESCFYYGAYEIDEQAGIVKHHVVGAWFPNWIGATIERFYEFADDKLILSTPPMMMGGVPITSVVIWTRFK